MSITMFPIACAIPWRPAAHDRGVEFVDDQRARRALPSIDARVRIGVSVKLWSRRTTPRGCRYRFAAARSVRASPQSRGAAPLAAPIKRILTSSIAFRRRYP